MTRLFYWIGIFLLGAVTAHLAFTLLLPKHEARALVTQMHRQMGANAFHLLQGTMLRRLVRHPLPDAGYGACVLDMAQQRGVALRGAALRAPWALTVHSPRGDVIYAITDRHVPTGPLNMRFEYRPPAQDGIIALPRMQEKVLVVPLMVRRAMVVLEVFPWHPGQVRLSRDLLDTMRCTEVAITTQGAGTAQVDAPALPIPRARPRQDTP